MGDGTNLLAFADGAGSPCSAAPAPLQAYKGRDGASAKRCLDLLIAVAALIVFSPLLVAVALLVRVTMGGPVIFAHRRIGKDGKHFPCLKFRTMRSDADQVLAQHLAESPEAREEWAATRKLREDPRVTALGYVLRRTSVDELPQLINIVRGEMSVVGPRPIVVEEVEKYGPYFEEYARVRPGLTGLWQISGRNDVSYLSRVELDRQYVSRMSVALDFVIIARTIPAVLLSRGCY